MTPVNWGLCIGTSVAYAFVSIAMRVWLLASGCVLRYMTFFMGIFDIVARFSIWRRQKDGVKTWYTVLGYSAVYHGRKKTGSKKIFCWGVLWLFRKRQKKAGNFFFELGPGNQMDVLGTECVSLPYRNHLDPLRFWGRKIDHNTIKVLG